MSTADPTKEELKDQLETTRNDLRVLMEMVRGRAGAEAGRARDAAGDRLAGLSKEARALLEETEARGADLLDGAGDAVRRNPVAAVGIAFGVGWLIGTLLRR